MTSRLRPGVIAALAVLAIDQATKLWLLFVFDIAHRGAVKVTAAQDGDTQSVSPRLADQLVHGADATAWATGVLSVRPSSFHVIVPGRRTTSVSGSAAGAK